ncbi:sugar ABC transporter substrate-binding protein [Pseudomonas sp. R2.Fl]|nr:sugar ABC transporter substrate-binding protein [Pseudomonas sp. R2.Fl]
MKKFNLIVSTTLALTMIATPMMAEDKIKIGFTTITLGDRFFVRLQDGMTKEAAKLGVDVTFQNPDGDPKSQFSAIENFMTEGTKVVIVDAIDPNGIQPALKAATAAGVKTIAVDEVLQGFPNVDAGVGLDNYNFGAEIAKRVLDYFEVHNLGKVYVGDIHTLDAPIENTRSKGFADFVKAHSEDMEIVGTVDAKFSIQEANKGAENLMTANPQLNLFFGSGGNYVIGALSAIRNQGKVDDVKIAGLDFNEQLVKALQDGIYVVAAETNPEEMGAKAIEVAVKLAKGEKVDPQTTVPVRFRTADDLDYLKATYNGQ